MRKLVLLRPQPGAGESAARAVALGLDPVVCPLFAIEAVAWTPPDPARFDALLVTSVNAVRHAGPELAALARLPLFAVGEATAAAARDAGLVVATVGSGGVEALLDDLPGQRRLLHLAGEDRVEPIGRHSITPITVYRAPPIVDPDLPDLGGMVVAVHSPRAGVRLADLVTARSSTAIAAISEAASLACGPGWQSLDWPARPTDSALLALAARLCQTPPR